MARQNIYAAIIEKIFLSKFKPGMRQVDFEREDIVKFGKQLKIDLPKNLGDLVYSFRYRAALPASLQSTVGKGEAWIIRPAGRGKYRFVLVGDKPLVPSEAMTTTIYFCINNAKTLREMAEARSCGCMPAGGLASVGGVEPEPTL
ncbi:MAG: hypothetical protein FJ279_27000, partial [Planctomycetes bacterium]|nr:hypothetical protein [Planctomycetota bacterium]